MKADIARKKGVLHANNLLTASIGSLRRRAFMMETVPAFNPDGYFGTLLMLQTLLSEFFTRSQSTWALVLSRIDLS